MIYKILRIIANVVIRLYYRQISINGLHNIPTDKPVFITSNHPNGFLEPIIMACVWPKALNFLVRGDLYDKPVLKPVMLATNQLPIYRFKDGFSSLRNNHKTIENVVEKLKENNHVIIFIEGGTKDVKHLRPFQKGMARMSMQALKMEESLDLQILPVGINFTDGKRFRSDVFLNIGKPISYQELHKESVGMAENEIFKNTTQHVFEKTKPMIFEEKEKPIDVGSLYFNLNSLASISTKSVVYDTDVFYPLREKVKATQKNSELQELITKTIYRKAFVLETVMAVLLLPLAIIGALVYMPMILLAYFMAKKLVKGIEFLSSVRFVIFLVSTCIVYLVACICAVTHGAMAVVGVLVLLLALGFSLFYCYSRLIERRHDNKDEKLVLKLKKILSS